MAEVPQYMTMGTVSKRTGCKVETIRYYERIGLLPAPVRSLGGHRHYDHDALKRRIASINDLPIAETDRKFHWRLGRRPDEHPGLTKLGL